MTDHSNLTARLRDVIFHNMDARLEAADALEAQARRIAELEAALKIKDANGHPITTVMRVNSKLKAALESRDAQIAELEAALRKFDFYLVLDSDKDTDTWPVLIGHIRAARAALEKKND